MTAKRALFAVALLAAGVVFLLAGTGNKGSAIRATKDTASVASSTGSKIIAYYFHVTARCTTCKTIEAYSHETIAKNFKSELDRGRLEWQVVNVQLPENKHFVKEYQLFTESVVLVHVAGGKQQSYKILNDVWQLVGDKAQFQSYVYKEVRGYLAKL